MMILLVEVGNGNETMTIMVMYGPSEDERQLDKDRLWDSL